MPQLTILRRLVLCLVPSLLFALTACSGGGSNSATPGKDTRNGTCKKGVPNSIALSLTNSNAVALTNLNFTSPTNCPSIYAIALDECGTVLNNEITPDIWTLNPNLGYLESTANSRATICFNKGATATPSSLDIQYSTFTKSTPLNVTWAPSTISNLIRWYRADSYMPIADDTTVGVNTVSNWTDLSPSAYNSYAANGREPKIYTSAFIKPAIRICGKSTLTGCTGITNNQHLRIASSFDTFATTDLTLIYVAARANSKVNYLLVNQSNGNNTGTFLGWTSNTQMRFGLAGPGGSPNLNATVPAFNGTPTPEIWMARLNSGSSTDGLGMQLYLNNSLLASNATVTQQSSQVTIPYIGTQRNDHNDAQFYVFEVILYNRALSPSEQCSVQSYLAAKYGLTLAPGC